MEAVLGLVSLAFSLVLVGFLTQWIGTSVVNGTLDRNGVIGIRTKVTRSSDAAWKAGHRAALPWLSAACRVSYVVGALTAVIVIVQLATGVANEILMVVPGVGYVGFLVLLLIGTRKANEAGRQATG